MRRTLVSALALVGVFGMALAGAAPSASAQTASGNMLNGLTRNGGPITVGTPVNFSWTIPSNGMFFVIATVSYRLNSTRTDTGGGAAAITCNLHHAGDGAIDISQAFVSSGPTSANGGSGELTLAGRFSNVWGATPLTVTCQNTGNARSSVVLDHLQMNLVPVAGFTNLAVAP